MKFCVLIIASLLLMNEESTAGEWKLIQTSDFNGASNANGADMQKVGAPAPEYLSVPGFESCLGSSGGSDGGGWHKWCLPISQPTSCPDESWDKIRKMKIDRKIKIGFCVAPTPNAEDMLSIGRGTGTPEYLSVPGFKSCLGKHKRGGSAWFWCLPLSKPKACLDESWAKLKKMEPKFELCRAPNPNGEDMQNSVGLPAPEYLRVPGFKSCLGSNDQGNSEQYCLPLSKPKACLDESWAELGKMKFDFCIASNPHGEDMQNSGCKLGCKRDGGYGYGCGYCVPLNKPKACLDESWAKLKMKFDLCDM